VYGVAAKVIYGDTDSLMIAWRDKTVAEAIRASQEVAQRISLGLPPPITLKYEKVYYPFLLQQNKKYSGVQYGLTATSSTMAPRSTTATTTPASTSAAISARKSPSGMLVGVRMQKLDVKGMESVRRDIIPLVRELMARVLYQLLVKRDTEAAVQMVKTTVYHVLSGKLDLSRFIITKALWRGTESDDYSAKQMHTALVEKLRKRDPSRSVVLGQRVSFVLIQAEKGARQHQQSEDPFYVLQHGLPLDLQLYVDNYLKKPIVRLFCLPGLFGSREEAERQLFSKQADHMLVAKRSTLRATIGQGESAVSGSFFGTQTSPMVASKCLSCNAPLKPSVMTTPSHSQHAQNSASGTASAIGSASSMGSTGILKQPDKVTSSQSTPQRGNKRGYVAVSPSRNPVDAAKRSKQTTLNFFSVPATKAAPAAATSSTASSLPVTATKGQPKPVPSIRGKPVVIALDSDEPAGTSDSKHDTHFSNASTMQSRDVVSAAAHPSLSTVSFDSQPAGFSFDQDSQRPASQQLPLSQSFCDRCRSDERAVAVASAEVLLRFGQLDQERHQAHAQCLRCQGSFEHAVLCVNGDCPVFWRRMQLDTEMGDVQATITQLSW